MIDNRVPFRETARINRQHRLATIRIIALALAGTLIASLGMLSPAYSAPDAGSSSSEAEVGRVKVVVQDFDEDMNLGDTQTFEYNVGEFETLGASSGDIGPGQYSAGYRSVRVYVSFGFGTYYKLSSYIRWHYSKSTYKVTERRTSWRVDDNDGLSDISLQRTDRYLYTWKSGVSNSGYALKRQWKVTRLAIYTYYPRIDIYAHGDGSAHWSKDTD